MTIETCLKLPRSCDPVQNDGRFRSFNIRKSYYRSFEIANADGWFYVNNTGEKDLIRKHLYINKDWKSWSNFITRECIQSSLLDVRSKKIVDYPINCEIFPSSPLESREVLHQVEMKNKNRKLLSLVLSGSRQMISLHFQSSFSFAMSRTMSSMSSIIIIIIIIEWQSCSFSIEIQWCWKEVQLNC